MHTRNRNNKSEIIKPIEQIKDDLKSQYGNRQITNVNRLILKPQRPKAWQDCLSVCLKPLSSLHVCIARPTWSGMEPESTLSLSHWPRFSPQSSGHTLTQIMDNEIPLSCYQSWERSLNAGRLFNRFVCSERNCQSGCLKYKCLRHLTLKIHL